MNKKPLAVSIIVISYNTLDMTLDCVRSIYEQAENDSFELIIVDNASGDGSADAIEREFSQANLIRSKENLGFARANNVAALQATGERILLLNPDTVILDHAIDRIVGVSSNKPDARIWGGRTVFADGTLNPASCWRAMSLWSIFCFATGISTLFPNIYLCNPEAYAGWHRDSDREVDFVSGCFLLIDRSLWNRLGGFDESFFMYAEEADLCFRAKHLGAKPMISPEPVIIHYGGASEKVISAKKIRLFRGKISYLYKHWPPMKRNIGIALFKLGAFIRAICYGAAALLTRSDRHKKSAGEWAQVWSNRHQWSQGYDLNTN